MSNTKDLNQKSVDKTKNFTEALKGVWVKFKETKINNYYKLHDRDDYCKTFFIVKNDFVDQCSVMDECIFMFRLAVKELYTVCSMSVKSLSEGGLFSLSNSYLKNISNNAKLFFNDLGKLKSAETHSIYEKNWEILKTSHYTSLLGSLDKVIESKIKSINNPAKIQDKKVKELMGDIRECINCFICVYINYGTYCVI